jgi:hypothetical protein
VDELAESIRECVTLMGQLDALDALVARAKQLERRVAELEKRVREAGIVESYLWDEVWQWCSFEEYRSAALREAEGRTE